MRFGKAVEVLCGFRGSKHEASSGNVNDGPVLRIIYSASKDLVGNRRNIALTEEKELEDVAYGIALGPREIAVRYLAGGFFEMYQHRGNGIRDDRTCGF